MLNCEIKVSLKYCGSCNPLIDLTKISKELKEAIEKENDLRLVSSESNKADTLVILCGCYRACGNKAEIRARATRSIVVAGETVDTVSVAEKNISTAVIKKIKLLTDPVAES